MSHKYSEYYDMNARSCVGLGRSLSLVTLPILVGLLTLRQLERQLGALGQLSESLLQGEQLPILKKVFGRTE
jgi:hypothetical protein